MQLQNIFVIAHGLEPALHHRETQNNRLNAGEKPSARAWNRGSEDSPRNLILIKCVLLRLALRFSDACRFRIAPCTAPDDLGPTSCIVSQWSRVSRFVCSGNRGKKPRNEREQCQMFDNKQVPMFDDPIAQTVE
jgi:hypothetical protein